MVFPSDQFWPLRVAPLDEPVYICSRKTVSLGSVGVLLYLKVHSHNQCAHGLRKLFSAGIARVMRTECFEDHGAKRSYGGHHHVMQKES